MSATRPELSSFTERHLTLVSVASILVLVILGLGVGRAVGAIGVQVVDLVLSHVATEP